MSAPERWLFWHRRDLRLADNLGLAAATAASPAVTGVYVLDPAVLAASDMAPARLWFLARSLAELQERWRAAGSRLVLLQGDPAPLLPALAAAVGAAAVAWNRDVEPDARALEERVAAALRRAGVRVQADWDRLLVAPESLRTGKGDPYSVYGPFLRSWRSRVESRQPRGTALAGGLEPVAEPSALVDLDPASLPAERQALWQALPHRERVGDPAPLGPVFEGADLCPCRPGERAAQEQLAAFADGISGPAPLLAYEPARNVPGEPGTSALSASLVFGTLSPRHCWAAASEARQRARSEEELGSIEVWEQELAWREFYQHALFHFPALAQGPFRPRWRQFPWENDRRWLEAWREGLTGVPIVDAAMRQLNESGWMHNRCRMIVASFLVKDLICDWRHGEAAFMARLVDGDLAANNGGWQWSASSGMDPRPLRIFNPATQAARYDPEAAYIRRWLPELARVSTADLLSGEIAPLERRGYPEPLVCHRHQQARFKALYAALPRG